MSWCLMAIAAVSACGCRGTPLPAVDAITIVSCFPRTESTRSEVESIDNGILLALEEADWRVGEYNLEFAQLNSLGEGGIWTPTSEERQANLAADNPDVLAFIGPFDNVAAEKSGPILKRKDLLMLSPTDATPADAALWNRPTDGTRPTYFRIPPSYDVQAESAAKWARSLGTSRVCILTDGSEYGIGLGERLRQKFAEADIHVASMEAIVLDEPGFARQIEKIAKLDPDLVYWSGIARTIAAAVSRATSLTCKFMVSDRCFEPEFVSAAGEDMLNNRCYVTVGGWGDPRQAPAEVRDFRVRYQRRFGVPPGAAATYGYETSRLTLHVLDLGRTKNRIAVLEAMYQVRGFDGLLGPRSVNEQGLLSPPLMSGYLVRGGRFEFVAELP
jgi:branched-chain amino acid transport system substrate-binding protein